MSMLIHLGITLAALAGYFTGMALTVRFVYGLHRTRFIRRMTTRLGQLIGPGLTWRHYSLEEAVAEYRDHVDGRSDGLLIAWFCGTLWPAMLIPAVIVPKITEWAERTVHKSADELLAEARAELKELERENQDLDRQLAQYDKRDS